MGDADDKEAAVMATALQETAQASTQVLESVDETLASVADKVFELLQSAAIDLSEADIRELLGDIASPESTGQGSSSPSTEKPATNTNKTLQQLPVVQEEASHSHAFAEEDLRTASTSAPSPLSTPEKSFEQDDFVLRTSSHEVSSSMWTPRFVASNGERLNV